MVLSSVGVRFSLAALAVVALGVGCSDRNDDADTSTTPRIHSTAKELEPGLVRAAELEQIPGAPRLRRAPDADAPVFENPDPRGPCGGVVDQPSFSNGAVVDYTAPGINIGEVIIELPEARARAFLDEFLADATPGCPPFRSMTNAGVTQEVTPTLVELPPVGDQRSATNSLVTTNGLTFHLGGVVVRRSGRIAVGMVFVDGPLGDDALQQLAQQMDDGLVRLERTLGAA